MSRSRYRYFAMRLAPEDIEDISSSGIAGTWETFSTAAQALQDAENTSYGPALRRVPIIVMRIGAGPDQMRRLRASEIEVMQVGGEWVTFREWAASSNPPLVPIGVSGGGRYVVYYRDGRKSFAFEDGVLAEDWAHEIGGRVEDRGPGGYVHYGRQNPAHADDLHDNWSGSDVQSLLFDRELFSATRAREWAKSHGFKYGSIDTTERYHHLRQHDPGDHPCRTISFGESGIKAVVCARSNPPLMKYECTDCGGRGPHEGPGHAYTTALTPGGPMEHECTVCGGRGPHKGAGHAYTTAPPRENPVGDEVHVIGGPARGRRGVVEHETEYVARVRFAEGGRGHLERGHLVPRGRTR